MTIMFNPSNLSRWAIGGRLSEFRIVDIWGVLDVTENGALLSADFSRVTIPAPKHRRRPIEATAGNVQLTKVVAHAARSGYYIVLAGE